MTTPRIDWRSPEAIVDAHLAANPPHPAGGSYRRFLVELLTTDRRNACSLLCGGCRAGWRFVEDVESDGLWHCAPGEELSMPCAAEPIRRGWGGVAPEPRCTACGCTNSQGCTPPCWWVHRDRAASTGLCSTCHERAA